MKIKKVNGRIAAVIVALVLLSGVVVGFTGLFSASNGVNYETPSGLSVDVDTDHDLDGGNPFNGTDTVEIDGTSITSSDDASLTVDRFSGEWTNVSSVETNSSTVSIDAENKSEVRLKGDVTDAAFKDATIDGKSAQAVYSASGDGEIIFTGLPENTEVAAATTGGDRLTVDTTTTDGELTVPVSSATDESIVLFEPSDPSISNVEPEDGREITDSEVELSADVSDSDFASLAGDSVEVQFTLNGEVVGNDTVTNNGTASVTASVDGGDQEWSVEAADSYNQTASSGTLSFATPSEITIRNASDVSQIVDGENATAEVTFYGDEGTVSERDVENGTVSFDGLPIDERFEVSSEIENYQDRVVVVPSILEQSDVYLLPDSTPTVQPRFVIESETGEFDSENSEIIIQRPITRNGSTEFVTVTAASPGIEGFDASLEEGQRYRIRVRDPGGRTRQAGSFRATASEQVTLRIDSAEFDAAPDVDGVQWQTEYLDEENGGPAVSLDVAAPGGFESVDVEIYERGNRSNNTVIDDSFQGNVSLTEPVAGDDRVYVVEWNGTKSNGETVTAQRQISTGKIPAVDSLDRQWTTIFAFVGTIIVGGLFTRANAGIGAVSVSVLGGIFWFIDWLPPSTTGLMVAVAMLVGVLSYVATQRRGVVG